MAEIKLDPTVLMECSLETRLITPNRLRLEIRPFTNKERLDFSMEFMEEKENKEGERVTKAEVVALFDKFVPTVVERIVGWDLTQGGQPLPCDAEAKRLYLVPLLWENVIPETMGAVAPPGMDPGDPDEEKTPDFRFLWAKVLKVISGRDSILKN